MPLTEKFEVLIPPQDIELYPGCLRLLANGDTRAFQFLYKNYSRKVFDYALLITQDKCLSEDIVQDVFLKLWSERQCVGGIENFNGYFYTIGRHCTLDKIRHQRTAQHYLDEYQRHHSDTIFEDDIIGYKESNNVFREAVNMLSPQQQLAYLLKHEHGWKRDRIAKELNVSVHTVKQHLQRAVKAVRKYFGKRIDS